MIATKNRPTLRPGECWPLTFLPQSEGHIVTSIMSIADAETRRQVARVTWYYCVDLAPFTMDTIKALADLHHIDGPASTTSDQLRCALVSVGFKTWMANRLAKIHRHNLDREARGRLVPESVRIERAFDEEKAAQSYPRRGRLRSRI